MNIDSGRQADLQETPSTVAGSTLSYNYLRGISEYLVSHSLDVEGFFEGFGIALDDLDDPSRRIAIATYQQMLVKAGALAGDANVGLHIGECIKPGQYGVLGYAVMSCKTAREAFERHERYENLVSDRAVSRYSIGEQEVSLVWDTGSEPVSREMAEENVASWIVFARWITGQNMPPSSIHFVHEQPEDLTEYKRIFDCPVEFSQSVVEVRFPSDYLSQPIIQHDPVMREMMDAHAERLLQDFIQTDGFLSDVRRILVADLANGTVSLDSVAEQLSLTSRTLQRRLSELGENFKSVLDQTRKDLALTYIAQPYIDLAELAYLLGFADQTAFQRAFKKWTGTTPGKYRKDQAR